MRMFHQPLTLAAALVLAATVTTTVTTDARADEQKAFAKVRAEACQAIRAELMWAMIVWRNYPSMVDEAVADADTPNETVKKAEAALTGSARKNTILQESVVPLSAAYKNLGCS